MKNVIIGLTLLGSIATYASVSEDVKVQSFDTKSKSNYTRLITRAILMKDLQLDLSQDDDIYFQNGEIVKESDLDKNSTYCQLDTDVESDSYSSEHVIIEGNKLTLKKGLIRAIEDVSVSPKFDQGVIEYDMNFIESVVKASNEVVDELECSVPLKIEKSLTVKDVKEITGGAFSFDILDIEGK